MKARHANWSAQAQAMFLDEARVRNGSRAAVARTLPNPLPSNPAPSRQETCHPALRSGARRLS